MSHGPPRELGDAPSLVLDGEIAIFDSQLISRFEWRRARLKNEVATPPMYMVLDLLELGGEDLRTQPLQERRQALEQLVADRSRVRPAVTPPIWLDEHGHEVPTRPCQIPDCTREWPVRRHRFEHLPWTGWPARPMVVVN